MPASESVSRPRAIVALVLLTAPYWLNDFANIFVHAPLAWVVCDYASRLVSLACLAWMLRRGVAARDDLQLRRAVPWRFAVAAIAGTLGGLFFELGPGHYVQDLWPQTQLGWIPPIAPHWLHVVDCSFGIALTAVTEEIIFRGIVPGMIVRLGASPAVALVVSSIAFGLIHWSLGLGVVLANAIIGLILGIGAHFARSLWPVIVAHYVIDLVAFW